MTEPRATSVVGRPKWLARAALWLGLVPGLSLFAACGQKGPLTLPKPPASAAAPASSPGR